MAFTNFVCLLLAQKAVGRGGNPRPHPGWAKKHVLNITGGGATPPHQRKHTGYKA